MAWDQTYRPLEKDEIILATDEVYDDGKKWVVTPNCAGKPAPDRLYTSHRSYRRLRTYDELVAYLKEIYELIQAGPREHSDPDYMEFLYETEGIILRAIAEGGWDDIPDTPEQRALIATHNADIRERYPNMVEITTA